MKTRFHRMKHGLAFLLSFSSFYAMASDWELVLHDSGTNAWEQNWFLEGAKAGVSHTPLGMVFSAGPVLRDHASHAVLWSRQSFTGDLKIEYDYTRIDTNTDAGVNILYIQATGLGTEDWPTDIFSSTGHRREPWMKHYFLHMNALHVSYATDGRYVSARRYPAADLKSFQTGTQIQPVYNEVDLFAPGETWHITAIKDAGTLRFIVERDGERHAFAWDTSTFLPVTEGRIGFRHMWTRSSRYADIRVFRKQ